MLSRQARKMLKLITGYTGEILHEPFDEYELLISKVKVTLNHKGFYFYLRKRRVDTPS